MTKVTVDSSLQKTLEGALGPVQVYTAEGQSLGYFVPSSIPLPASLASPTISRDELARREREGSHISTAELLRRLETR